MKTDSFGCIECGLCCVHLPTWMLPAIEQFPYETDENGQCEKLDGTRCSVYENRPLLCNLEQIDEELNTNMTKAEWYGLNAQGCNILLREAGRSDRLKIEYREIH